MNMNVEVRNLKGDVVNKTFELPETIFGVAMNNDVVHQVLRALERQKLFPTAHTKTRGEVRGGGRKPWKQKGTGRARHGSTRSPIWAGGGITFGPRNERNFSLKVNKKVRRKALMMVLSQSLRDEEFTFVDALTFDEAKTKTAIAALENLGLAGRKVLVVHAKKNENVTKSFRNIPGTQTVLANSLNVEDVLKYDAILADIDSVQVIADTYKV
jgi:large subunit ribosomal protein L4